MPQIKIIVVGQTKLPFLREGQHFYLDRLRHYTSVEWVEVKPVPLKKNTDAQSMKDREGISILRQVNDRDYVVALDQRGKEYDSPGLASRMEKIFMEQGGIALIVGGVMGLSGEILRRAQETVSLSQFTLTHEMARLFLLEQLYRAFTIMRGEKYHK